MWGKADSKGAKGAGVAKGAGGAKGPGGGGWLGLGATSGGGGGDSWKGGGDTWAKGGGAAWSGADAGKGGAWGGGGGDQWGGSKGGGGKLGPSGGGKLGPSEGGKFGPAKGGGKDAWGKGDGGKDPWSKGDGGKDAWGKGGGKDAWGKGDGGKDAWGGGGKDAWGGGGKGKGGGKDAWGGGGKGGKGGQDWLPEQSAYVKTWNEERGFGFVTVASGEDVYVHRTTLADGNELVKDTQVWLEAKWEWEKSKWTATWCSGAAPKGAGKGGAPMGKGKDKGGGKGGKGKRGVDWMQGTSASVKTWTEERGFGFVSTEGGEDIYVHRTALVDGSVLELQAQVSVDAAWNWEKNKWHATKVTGASGDPPRAQTAGFEKPAQTGSQGGTVKAWQEKGGYGFLTPENGGPDVFCHSSCLTQGTTTLHVGEAVVFDLQMDEKKGKYLAFSCYSTASGGAPLGGSFGPAAGTKAAKRSEPYNAEEGDDAELAAQIEALM